MFIKPVIDANGMFSVEFNRFGPTGIIVGIAAGYMVSILFHLVGRLNPLGDSSLPDFVIGWVQNIIPIITSIGLTVFLTFYLNIDLFALVLLAFSPIQNFGQTLPGFVLLIFLMTFFYTLGISHWLWNGVKTPIFMAGIAANIACGGSRAGADEHRNQRSGVYGRSDHDGRHGRNADAESVDVLLKIQESENGWPADNSAFDLQY